MVTTETTEYGQYSIESKRRSGLTRSSVWYVESYDGDRVRAGEGKGGKKRAQTLAATLAAAGTDDFQLLPPGMLVDDRPRGHPQTHSENEYEAWAAETNAVPGKVAGAGKAPLAGYLKIVHRQSEGWIANHLGVSEASVRQYLSDLRAGRR